MCSIELDPVQEVVGQKDQQIAELQEQLFRMREQLIAANMDSDKASISAALTQVQRLVQARCSMICRDP